MNFRAARTAGNALSADEAMDPSNMPSDSELRDMQPDVGTDGQDPATPGGAAPYNGADPYSQPVTDDPEWCDPREAPRRGGPVPFHPGPTQNVTTIHNARRMSYDRKITRTR